MPVIATAIAAELVRIVPVLIAESLGEDLDLNSASFPLPGEKSARQRQAAILFPAIPVPSRRPDTLAVYGEEVLGARSCGKSAS